MRKMALLSNVEVNIMMPKMSAPFGPCKIFGYLPVNQEMEEKRQRIQEGLWHLGQITSVPEPEFKYTG